jgi:hypothetical protein
MKIVFSDWKSLAVVVTGALFLIFAFSGVSGEVFPFVLSIIRALRS